MSYLVLARKSRPQTFAEVVGQKPIVRTLQNALAQNRMAHALIFSGIRGTGKTTLARIMAKALNCEQGPAVEPCNQCRSCREIAEGTSIDLQEVDGASNRGIQEIRELKEKIRFMPTSSRFKIIIIDEVHMLTTEAFNALLKTLEEPPEHVYFMFATTELHKVPVTILSRCQRYELKRLAQRELAEHFARLAAGEGVTMEPQAVEMIVRECGGSVRDGLSLLDQIFSYCGSEVRAEDVVAVLGLVNHQLVAHLGCALLHGDLSSIYTLLDQMYLHGVDLKRFSNDLLHWFRNLVVCKISPDPGSLLEASDDELAMLQATASQYGLETITGLFDLLMGGLERAASSPQPRLTLEMVFIRAVQIKDVVPVSTLIAQFDQLLAGVPLTALPITTPSRADSLPVTAASVAPVTPAAAVAPPVAAPQPIQPTPSKELPTAQPEPAIIQAVSQHDLAPQQRPASPPVMAPASDAPPAITSPATAAAATNPVPAAAAPQPQLQEGKKRIRQHWDDFLRYVRERQPWISASLQMATAVERQEGDLIIRFSDSADCTMLKQRANIKVLSEYLLDFFQQDLKVQFEVPGSDACAVDPANGLAAQNDRRALANDPLVLTALDVFTGQVGDIRIGAKYRLRSTTESTKGEAQNPAAHE